MITKNMHFDMETDMALEELQEELEGISCSTKKIVLNKEKRRRNLKTNFAGNSPLLIQN